ncbi:type II secretion system protein GspK [Anaeromyxobacter oryzisoli]|uniref:type II secretion system protein GspK n=1 Tax=Anaeromyxobacter oryzisoli TaxID=2925408 RepID=UPI001F56EBA5|nr:type II secretion system protein GspK [Anaeromyxobacter sp. SG63]
MRATERTSTGRRGSRRSARGAALLLVMVAIAILTALAADVAYDNQVRLRIAANGRDALRAEALARSAVNLSRLVLAFQAQIDQSAQAMCSATASLTATGQTATAAGQTATGQTATGQTATDQAATSQAAACPRVQIWSVIPVSSGLVQALFGGGASPGHAAAPEGGARAAAAFGDFQGAFEARIEDEGAKVNLQFDSMLAQTGTLPLQVESYLRLVCDPRWDPLFEREDANGQRTTRQELAAYLRDWADEDKTSSALAASFPGGGACNFVLAANPFEQGFGDEGAAYDRGSDPYRPKNARLDSVDELYLVAGVSDAFMAAFGDAVTVYQPADAGLNVNSSRPEDELRIARLMADPAAAALVSDPAFPDRLHKALMDVRMGGFLTLSPSQFAAVVTGLGVPVRAEYATGSTKNLTDRSFAYRIRATGAVGDVEEKIDAVVTFDPQKNADPQAGKPLPGRLIHWREE